MSLPISEALTPFGRVINAVIRFRLLQTEGEISLDAVPEDPQVRMADSWLRSIAALDTEGGAP